MESYKSWEKRALGNLSDYARFGDRLDFSQEDADNVGDIITKLEGMIEDLEGNLDSANNETNYLGGQLEECRDDNRSLQEELDKLNES
jgi:chromosome segregation ATPase